MDLKAILFDMDGTLIPMDQEIFVQGYLKELSEVLCPLGVNPEKLVAAIWDGTGAMMANDGQRRNDEVFWEHFLRICPDVPGMMPALDRFYREEFHKVKVYTGENPLAAEAVRLAHGNGRKVVLATNPLFPMDGQMTRMSWVGLRMEDFDLVTSYETDWFCKPNPQYYHSICERIGVAPQECLMIGNDEKEDMYAAAAAGMNCYLVTDTCILREKYPWNGEKGTFAELVEKLKGIK
ncbi:MAG: HAD family hydrolase [Lachnospiraceae bacterium]|nr:HAD family hydrolase [Lachnospiraceae bacterium]